MTPLFGTHNPWWAGGFRWWCLALVGMIAWLAAGGGFAPLWVLLGLSVVLGLGVARPGWRFFGPIVSDCGDPRAIALTFDDGPDPALTGDVLRMLKARGMKATFFLVGKQLLAHPDLARQIVADGHMVASHSFDHSIFSNFRLTGAARCDLQATRAAFREVLGIDPHLHRPPVGLTNPHLFQALRREGMRCVCWNRTGRDGGNRRLEGITKIGDLASPGAIVCLHDVLPRPELKEDVLNQLDRLLADIAQRRLVTVRLDAVPGLGKQANPNKTAA